ncbi:2-succinylbenzoate--CoA ligase [Vibrio aerogenes CECT 7868]|uniref:2-succinylbenzoate--CoA ligase n=2 Tax=Vibrio aerogenes TaxID=92172 RepID=A0A1M5XZZ5_9VIBR|nr:o-succinylbenzoate--CoA ligase [Vibrio aerogenes]SHI05312.1 2-succinylbenzoate--CoA ligase [Vibrio aerogenes CECT 7868]
MVGINLTGMKTPLWQHRAFKQPGAVAFITEQQTYTWQDVSRQASRYADWFRQQGIQPGEVITLAGRNRPEWIWCFLGAMAAGITTAFLAPQPLEKLRQKLQTIYAPGNPVWLIAEASPEIQMFSESQTGIRWFREVLQADGPLSDQPLSDKPLSCEPVSDEAVHDESMPDKPSADKQRSDPDVTLYHPDHISSLIFTSGSTGIPKAVAHTSCQHLASARGLLSFLPFGEQDCWLLSLPLYHVSGLSVIYRWLLGGGQLKMGDELATSIQGVSHASLVPVQLQRLLDNPQVTLDLTHVLLGGGDIPLPLTQQASERGIQTWVGYGMTEAASTVTAKLTDGQSGCGHTLPGREVLLREQRIYIRGETLAAGYYHQGLLRAVTDDEGWFDTKDLGYWTEGGLHINGRADNQFISGGENIHCEEIEQVLLMHPQIEQAVVIPVKDETYGARPVAVVSTNSGELPDADSLDIWLQNRLEKFKWPLAWYLMPEELMSTGIKVSRFEIKQWLTGYDPQRTVMR